MLPHRCTFFFGGTIARPRAPRGVRLFKRPLSNAPCREAAGGGRAPKGAVHKLPLRSFAFPQQRSSARLIASAHAFRRSTAAILNLGTVTSGYGQSHSAPS